jgi:hypothetical protein
LLTAIKKINSTTTCYLIKPDGTLTNDSLSTAEVLVNKHFPGNSCNPYNKPINNPIILEEVKWINPTLIKQSFSTFKPNKASGPDELKPILLHNLPPPPLSSKELNLFSLHALTLVIPPHTGIPQKQFLYPNLGKNTTGTLALIDQSLSHPSYSKPLKNLCCGKQSKPVLLTSLCIKTNMPSVRATHVTLLLAE